MFAVTSLMLAAGLLASPSEAKPTSQKYSLSFAGTSEQLKLGAPGVFALKIDAAPGFHISADAPLKIKLSGQRLKLSKATLKQRDSKAKKPKGRKYVTPEFVVPMEGTEAGAGKVLVDASFFVCDAKMCEHRRAKKQLPVEVQP